MSRISWLVALIALAVAAQEPRCQIVGRVLDRSGGVVSEVEVHVVHRATAAKTSSVTNRTGDYILPFLQPGLYDLYAGREGFKAFARQGLDIRVGDRITVNITLEIGETSETIKVSGDSPTVEASTASSGQVIDQRQIADLPLKDGNPIMLSSLASGVLNLTTRGMTRPFNLGSSSRMSAIGVRSGGTEYTLDGAPNNTMSGTVAFIPPAGVVQEFRIHTAAFDASLGYAAAAVVNVSIKSGTNDWHGSAYDFLQNPALNANRFFANRVGEARASISLNRWGAVGSGPLSLGRFYNGRNRTFWMWGYEGIHDADTRSLSYSTPTDGQRRGDFSELLAVGPQYQIYDPFTIAPAAAGSFSRRPFPGNHIPFSRIHPTARTLTEFYPQPNRQGNLDGTENLFLPPRIWDHYFTHVIRMDHQFTEKHRSFLRGNFNRRQEHFDRRFANVEGFDGYLANRGLALDHVYLVNSAFLVNLRYSYTRYISGNVPFTSDSDPSAYGFSTSLTAQARQIDSRAPKMPRVDVSGMATLSSERRWAINDDTHDFALGITRIAGSHELRFGAGYRVYRQNSFDLGQPSGDLVFGTEWTRGPYDTSAGAPAGQSFASFLLGLPTGGGIDVNGSYAQQSTIISAYFHDNWKITRRLTLNLGLRYEMEDPLRERFNRSVRGFDARTTSPLEAEVLANYRQQPMPEVPSDRFRVLGGLEFAGAGGLPPTLWTPDRNNLMPRAGAAYALDPKTVLQASYGLFFDQLGASRQAVNQAGFSRRTDLVASLDNGQSFLAYDLRDPFPNGFETPLGAAGGLLTSLGQGIRFFHTGMRTPYMQRWKAGIQRQAFGESVFEVAYVGNRGTKLRATRALNAVPREYLSVSPVRDQAAINYLAGAVPNPFFPLLPKTALAGTTVSRSQLLRPYPHFTQIAYESNQGYSWYHSLQTRFERRFRAGYAIQASWTWSKFMEAVMYRNETDPVPEKLISEQDRTHRIVVATIWELPFGARKRFAAGARGLAGKLIGRWQVQAVYQGQSGQPLGFGNAIFNGSFKDIAIPNGRRTVDRWFNIDAGFDRDPRRQLAWNVIGLSSRFSGIRADGLNHWDLSAIKNTQVTERLIVQFRTEASNAFNHAHFNPPETNPSRAGFGAVTAESQLPRVVQFGLKLSF
ncbi:MAG TPA: TonB-dependent receptor [Bryobacteraceae bacterium]|nr:TonB-dependent receptor [Bryobacteraceae bacterium]